MTCPHDAAEQDTAAHWDGLCPLCLKAEVEALRAELAALRQPAVSEEEIARLFRRHVAEIAALLNRPQTDEVESA